MKVLSISVLLQLANLYSFSQASLNNTKWDARITIPQTTEVRLEFTRDTFFISRPNGRVAEASYFTQRNDSLLIRKLSGVSPCSPGYEAWYKIEWMENGNRFSLQSLTDTCRQRANSWKSIMIQEKVNK